MMRDILQRLSTDWTAGVLVLLSVAMLVAGILLAIGEG